MSTVITIAGTSVGLPRPVTPVRIVPYVKGGIESFTFETRGGALPGLPDPYTGKAVTVSIGGSLVFSGEVISYVPRHEKGVGWVLAYQCVGLRSLGDHMPHTDSNTGLDRSVYNAAEDTQSTDYLASRAGRTVGQIFTDVLTMTVNAQKLNAYGIGNYTGLPSAPALPSTTVSDLSALTWIPPGPITFGGEKLLNAVESLLAQIAPTYCFRVQPDGTMRFLNLRAFTAHTLTLGTDPILPTPLARDTDGCYSQVVVRGAPVAEMFLFSLSNGGLSEAPFAHDGLTVAQAIAAWTFADWQGNGSLPSGLATCTVLLSGGAISGATSGNVGYGYPASSTVSVALAGGGGTGGAIHGVTNASGQVTSYVVDSAGSGYTSSPTAAVAAPGGTNWDTGTCTCPSTTTVLLTPIDKTHVWPTDFWDQSSTGRQGNMLLWSSVVTGVQQYAQRRAVANASLSPGGTCLVTLDLALPNTSYDGYLLTGQAGNASAVWTTFELPSWAGPLVAPQSTYPFPFKFANGTAETLTSSALGIVLYSPDGNPPYSMSAGGITVDQGSGYVIFAYPVYATAGGVPADVQALVPIYTTTNSVTAPSVGNYQGTYYTVEGIERTLTLTVPSWRDPLNASGMQAWSQNVLDSVKDTKVEGQVTFLGLYTPALTMGIALNIAGNGYTTGWESSAIAAVPVVECQLEYGTGPGNATSWITTMKCSNRMAHFDADQFLKPDRTGMGFDFGNAAQTLGQAAIGTRAAAGGATEAAGGSTISGQPPSGGGGDANTGASSDVG